ncbi:MAG: OmpA family protein [Rickettsiales bacterium]|jgi:chemotaxis protein MotB|nr:OmpA family protein [Rickettsiales bacterium]
MIKVRERTNSWPSFVDLFSNLVIVLMFLLIIFVFLWTSTGIFGKTKEIGKLTELRKISVEQTEKIKQLSENEKQARDLLISARDELVALDAHRAGLEEEKSELAGSLESAKNEQMEIVAAYEQRLYDLQASKSELSEIVEQLRAQLGEAMAKEADGKDLLAKAAGLAGEVERLNNALAAAEAARAERDVEYASLSGQLNKAMADRLSELNQLTKFQSQFFGAVRDALAGMGGVDVSSDRFVISSDILFPVGGFTLSPEGKNQISIIANIIKTMESKIPENVRWVIRVDGHTDRLPVKKGSKLYKNNLDLSLLRAKEVTKHWEKNGVSGRRLIPSGFGETHPVVEGKTAKDLQKNRRIELRLTNP